ncbi:MAG: hypothetical protein K0Q76_2749 [Panacagrimonas sp.]|jgi:hypothetical protein|nr:hypothetical protein [Panacagrimonas sp.]MCC2657641.1 hypothetical protein [Panacagrimonas sp.]
MALNDWMSSYQDTKLVDLIIPGAHDAGTYLGTELRGPGATSRNSHTQNMSIGGQLACGTRFFDLRLMLTDSGVKAHHTTAGIGAYGDTVNRSILEAAAFCHANPSEVVIVRVTHTKVDTDADEIIKKSSFYGGRNQLSLCTGNIALMTPREIIQSGRTTKAGGGLVCVLDSDSKISKQFITGKQKVKNSSNFDHHGKVDQAQGIHPFHKFKAGVTLTTGLATCGCYKGSHKLSEVIGNALKGGYDHTSHPKNHLWQIYWQKTYVNPFSKTGIQDGTKKNAKPSSSSSKVEWHGGTQSSTNHLLHLTQGHLMGGEDYTLQKENKKKGQAKVLASTWDLRNLRVPNIISYDFVNGETNKKIIDMNKPGVQFFIDGGDNT